MQKSEELSTYPQIFHWLKESDVINLNSLIKLKTYLKNIETIPPIQDKHLLQLILQEIYILELPILALRIIDNNKIFRDNDSYEFIFTEGVFSLAADELFRAEICFNRAHELAPEELAPLTNLGQVMFYKEEWNLAWNYCLQGLEREKNHTHLWQLIYEILLKTSVSPLNDLNKLSNKFNSWKGCSLYIHLESNFLEQDKVDMLSKFYMNGEVADDFLIEYTGALGACSRFKDILNVIWKSVSAPYLDINWKLVMHQLQAQFELGEKDNFNECASKFLKRSDVPKGIVKQVAEMSFEK